MNCYGGGPKFLRNTHFAQKHKKDPKKMLANHVKALNVKKRPSGPQGSLRRLSSTHQRVPTTGSTNLLLSPCFGRRLWLHGQGPQGSNQGQGCSFFGSGSQRCPASREGSIVKASTCQCGDRQMGVTTPHSLQIGGILFQTMKPGTFKMQVSVIHHLRVQCAPVGQEFRSEFVTGTSQLFQRLC